MAEGWLLERKSPFCLQGLRVTSLKAFMSYVGGENKFSPPWNQEKDEEKHA